LKIRLSKTLLSILVADVATLLLFFWASVAYKAELAPWFGQSFAADFGGLSLVWGVIAAGMGGVVAPGLGEKEVEAQAARSPIGGGEFAVAIDEDRAATAEESMSIGITILLYGTPIAVVGLATLLVG
jgi:hypothetical protein